MKTSLICTKMTLWAELIFIWMVLHKDSLWHRGKKETRKWPITEEDQIASSQNINKHLIKIDYKGLTLDSDIECGFLSRPSTVDGNTGIWTASLKLKVINTSVVATKEWLIAVKSVLVDSWTWICRAVKFDGTIKFDSTGDICIDWKVRSFWFD